MIVRTLLILLAAVSLAGCSIRIQPVSFGMSPDQVETMADENMRPDETELVDRGYNALIDRQPEIIFDDLALHLQNDQGREALAQMASQFPAGPPVRSDLITFRLNTFTSASGEERRTLSKDWAVTFDDGRVMVVFIQIIQVNDGPIRIEGYRFREADPALWAEPETLGPARIAVLVVAGLTPLLILGGIVAVFRIRRLRRRWLWLLVCVITVPTVQFNWSTENLSVLAPTVASGEGNWSLQLMIWVVTGVEIAKAGDYHPWLITIGMPLGALLFWFRYATGTLARKDDGLTPPDQAVAVEARDPPERPWPPERKG
jgi:hypothetical protein